MINVQFFTFGPIQENTYILSNEKGEALIIDPGCYFSAEQETLKNYISGAGLNPVQLLNTHCHFDHIFGNKWVAETYHLEPFIHPLEERMLQLAPASALMYGLGFDNYKGPLHFLKEGDGLQFGNHTFQILFTPGHSPGSISFYCSEQNFVVSGDVLFYESIGRSDLPGGSQQHLLQSIQTRLFTLPGETVVYSGHGPQTTIGYEKKFNPFLQ